MRPRADGILVDVDDLGLAHRPHAGCAATNDAATSPALLRGGGEDARSAS